MDMIQTDRTYKTRDNAEKALIIKLALLGETTDTVRYLIAVKDDGRFAPVVMHDNRKPHLVGLAHHGVTVIG